MQRSSHPPPCLDAHANANACSQNWDLNALNASKFSGLSTCIFVLFCIANTIVMLNLLIALMTDRCAPLGPCCACGNVHNPNRPDTLSSYYNFSFSFDRVQENALAQGRYEQALSIQQVEAMLAPSIRLDPRFFPRYLQVLRPKTLSKSMAAGGDSRRHEWTGRLQRIYKKVEASERRLGREVGLVIEKLNSMEARLGASFVAFDVQDDEEDENEEGEVREGPARSPAASVRVHGLGRRLRAPIRSSYYHPEDEEDEPMLFDEVASYHSDASSVLSRASSTGAGPFASGDSVRFTSGPGIPRIAPPAIQPPPVPLVARAISSASSRGRRGAADAGGAKAEGDGAAAAMREMGDRLMRLEAKLDALIGAQPTTQGSVGASKAK